MVYLIITILVCSIAAIIVISIKKTAGKQFNALKKMTDDESEHAKIVLYNDERGLEMDIAKYAKHDYSLSSGYQSDSEIFLYLDSIHAYNRL